MNEVKRIDLAHAPRFELGELVVRPATREVVRGNTTEIVEPRVMQVLVCLLRAQGAIVSRDDLARECWEGRIVGDDAINRVMSRLRRLSEGIGAGLFRVETVTKVGYRLTPLDPAWPVPVTVQEPAPDGKSPTRRRFVIGGAALGAVAAAAVGYGAWRSGRTGSGNREVATLMDQAAYAMRQETREGQNQAIGLYRRATELDPGNAPAWGHLAACYAYTARWRAPQEAAALRQRGAQAARRAAALDPGNLHAGMAQVLLKPLRGNWLEKERMFRSVMRRDPHEDLPVLCLACMLGSVGRLREAADLGEGRGDRWSNPSLYYRRILSLWGAGRLDEADRLLKEARSLFPTHFALWFEHCYILMHSGRAAAAVAMIDDADNRPAGIPSGEFAQIGVVARAMVDRSAAATRNAVGIWRERALQGSGYAENAIQFASALGDLDTVFAIADAYYFGRGFVVPDVRFTVEQGTYLPVADRETEFLFNPAMAPARADPRFPALVGELKLERYWREAGTQPDYRKA